MIQNTTLQRWHRAAARNLDAQFMTAIQEGMNCSPFEAQAIRDAVQRIYAPLMETSASLKPGQVRLSVIEGTVPPNIPLAQARQRLVVLTLDAGAEDRAIRERGGVIALRRHRVARICEEAFQQGGLLTLEGIADLFNCAVRTLVTDLAALRAEGLLPPLRSTVKDMGRAVTHRRLIVERWLAGDEYSAIARQTHHSLEAVANYIDKFKRCAALSAAGFDRDTLGMIARLSPSLVLAYESLLAEAHPVPSRQEELEHLTKKNTPLRQSNSEVHS